ncbi:ferredoxin [Cupriavidus sp. USMAA2-4]|uniref:2Fe-2S iron-sulfur cluster-binding protein n=1 Tax=unclassified Cupriavidus TaxID=2640874 RepID=UPI0008A6A74D|nr:MULTISPECIES: 2Fe-2S iron-sulfur cluster-binding protein [unclassified Cupriavidus]AOY94867.1 ferredoxin [Cupriavidus sp. USMAA2-4]AOZ02272.1 ferredoxin [Cupriavidus sp. USMAHM13]
MSAPSPHPATATLEPAGTRFPVAPGQTLLEAALRAGVTLPHSCRNGTCRTCMCKLHAGAVDYRIAWPGLSLDEKEDGMILACVALPRGDVVIEVATPF